jgi:hypothetical protein
MCYCSTGIILPYMGFLFRVNRGKNKLNNGVLFEKISFLGKQKDQLFVRSCQCVAQYRYVAQVCANGGSFCEQAEAIFLAKMSEDERIENPEQAHKMPYQGTRIVNAPFLSRKQAPATKPAGGGLAHPHCGAPNYHCSGIN